MYPFPSEFDVREFHFAELEMICFAANSMYLHFGRKLCLTVECDFEHCEKEADLAPQHSFPLQSSGVMQLIGSRVTEAKVSEQAVLTLQFDSGSVLRIHPDAAYESYRIAQDGREIII